MASLEYAVRWTDDNGQTFTLPDVKRITVRKSAEAKHSTMEVTLQNSIFGSKDYVTNGDIKFNTNQDIELYALYDESGAGIDVTDTDQLLFSGRVIEFNPKLSPDKSDLVIKCSDSSFIALNKLWVGDEVDTPPELIIDIVGFINDANPDLQITAALTTSSGQVAAAKSDASAFDDYQLAKVFKPAYEVIQELSQPGATGEDAPYRFHIDKFNELHWFYPDDSAQHVMAVGASTAQSVTYKHPITGATETVNDSNIHYVKSSDLKRAVYDVVNFIVYKAGEDMNNTQIMNFKFDETSGTPVTKDSFVSWEDIARDLKEAERKAGNITRNQSDDYNFPSGYPVTTTWGTSCANNTEYNTAFVTRAQQIADNRCAAIFSKTGSPRWKGKIPVLGKSIYDPNDGMIYTDQYSGINRVFFRIIDVQHTLSKTGWFTELNVEEEIPKEA